jgi:hypothetical protein
LIFPALASCATVEVAFQILMSGTALFEEISSSNNPSQSTFTTEFVADFLMSTSHLYVEIHPPFESDFETIFEVVFFPI